MYTVYMSLYIQSNDDGVLYVFNSLCFQFSFILF